jgi:Protein of unknown function (DUF2384)
VSILAAEGIRNVRCSDQHPRSSERGEQGAAPRSGGVRASESTLSRIRNRKRGPIPLGTKEGELALLFLRVFRSLDALVGGNQAHAKAWLHAENHHLGGVPLRRMKKIEGLVDVAEYLDAMRGTI